MMTFNIRRGTVPADSPAGRSPGQSVNNRDPLIVRGVEAMRIEGKNYIAGTRSNAGDIRVHSV
ncbi:hypothetical protein, partial [Azotobacter vinelandii]